MVGISGSLIWSKTLVELIFNRAVVNLGEVRRAQSAKPTLLTSQLAPLVFFLDLLRSVQMLKRLGCGKQWEATAPIQSR